MQVSLWAAGAHARHHGPTNMRIFCLTRRIQASRRGCHAWPHSWVFGPWLGQLGQLSKPAAHHHIGKPPSHPPTPAQNPPDAPAPTRAISSKMKAWSPCRCGSALPRGCRTRIRSYSSPSSTSRVPTTRARERLRPRRQVRAARAREGTGHRVSGRVARGCCEAKKPPPYPQNHAD